MNRMMCSMMKGLGAGMVVGLAVGAAGSMMMNSNGRRFRKNGRRAAHAMEDLIGNVAGMIH
ncbi:MAG: hypothetical protein IJY28_02570 [Clostridia bacterium]|nr:hypothetical protein [Clostridia bacterium]